MRVHVQPFDCRRPPLGTIYGVVLTSAAIVAATWLWLDLPRMVCPLRKLAGLPCPTCGSTRMVEAMLRGDFAVAFTANPLVFLVLASAAIWSIASTLRRVFAWPAPQLVCTRRDLLWIRVVAMLAVLSGWAYVILFEAGSGS